MQDDEPQQPQDQPQQEQNPREEDNPVAIAPIQMLLKTNSFVDRYFKRYYTNEKAQIQQYLYLHSNGLAVIGITKQALDVFQGDEVRVSYQCLTDNTADIVKGKKKKGGVRIHPSREIATIGNQKITLIARGLIEGHVIEFNEALLSNPKLLMESPQQRGYLIVVMPKGHLVPQKHWLVRRQ